MNEFQLQAELATIKSTRGYADTEELIRKHVKVLPLNWRDPGNLWRLRNHYIAATAALAHYKSKKGLPQFINKAIRNFEQRIFSTYIELNFSYEEYIKTFQFTDIIVWSHSSNLYNILPLIKMIGDKPQPYKIEFNLQSNSAFYSPIDYDTKSSSTAAAICAQYEYHKLLLDPNIKYTLLEQILDHYYQQAKSIDLTKLDLMNKAYHITQERINGTTNT
jgi:hypothetical protein